MSDTVKEAEIVEEQALAKLEGNMEALVKEADKAVFKAMAGMDTLDWSKLKPNQTALLLMQKPFSVSGGGTMYLNFKQALLFAVRCYELGLSPFSDSVWFDANRNTVNLTLAGKRELARLKGIDLGPPQFEEVFREWKDVPRVTENVEAAKKAGFTKDVGIKCKIRVGDPKNQEAVEYIAYLSEWFVPRSPVWGAKPIHMLQTRATEKAISLAMGTGASSLPSEAELD
ncbi:MAG TPA: hypothetical protein VM577_08480 [Anaerovoracaceae bacterium]|nr:hypothetical protein [Anaerovoracaceae bacterium]